MICITHRVKFIITQEKWIIGYYFLYAFVNIKFKTIFNINIIKTVKMTSYLFNRQTENNLKCWKKLKKLVHNYKMYTAFLQLYLLYIYCLCSLINRLCNWHWIIPECDLKNNKIFGDNTIIIKYFIRWNLHNFQLVSSECRLHYYTDKAELKARHICQRNTIKHSDSKIKCRTA